jgi:hypothetical protein
LGGDPEPRCAICAGAITSDEGVARIGDAWVHGECFVKARGEQAAPAHPPTDHPGRVRRFVAWLRMR